MSEESRCPHEGCDFAGSPAEMFDHFKESRQNFEAHGATSSAAEQVALAVGVRDYRRGFKKTAGRFDAGGLEVTVTPAVVGSSAGPAGRTPRSTGSS